MLVAVWILPEWHMTATKWLKELNKIPHLNIFVYYLENVHIKATAGIELARALMCAPDQLQHANAFVLFGSPLAAVAMNGFQLPVPLAQAAEIIDQHSTIPRLRYVNYKGRSIPAIFVNEHQNWHWGYRKWLDSIASPAQILREAATLPLPPPLPPPPDHAVIWDMKFVSHQYMNVTWVDLTDGQMYERRERVPPPVIAFWPESTAMAVSSGDIETTWAGLIPREDTDQESIYKCLIMNSWDDCRWLKPGAHFTNGNSAAMAILLRNNWRVVPSCAVANRLQSVKVRLGWRQQHDGDKCPQFVVACIDGIFFHSLAEVFERLQWVPFVDVDEHEWALLEYALTEDYRWPYPKILTENARFVFDMANLVGGIPLLQLDKTSDMEHFAAIWMCHQNPKFPAYPACRVTPPETPSSLAQLVPLELRQEILHQIPVLFKMNALQLNVVEGKEQETEAPHTVYEAQIACLTEKCPHLLPQINKIRHAKHKPASGGFFELIGKKRICRDRKREIDIRRAYPNITIHLNLSPDKGKSLVLLMQELLHKRDNADSEEERKAAKLLSVHGYAFAFWHYPTIGKHITAKCRRFAHQMLYAATHEHCQAVVTDGIIVCEHAAEEILDKCKQVLPPWVELETKTYYDDLVLFGVNQWSWHDAESKQMKSKGLGCEASNTAPIVAEYERDRLEEIHLQQTKEFNVRIPLETYAERLTSDQQLGRMMMKIKRKSARVYKDLFWKQHLSNPWNARKGKLFYWYAKLSCDDNKRFEHALELNQFLKLDVERYTAQMMAIDKSIAELPYVECIP